MPLLPAEKLDFTMAGPTFIECSDTELKQSDDRLQGIFDSPYPGPRAFEAHESPLLFGRDLELFQIQNKLKQHRFLILTGSQSCGKTSLIRAGLIPRLLKENPDNFPPKWVCVETRPGTEPYKNLYDALKTVFENDLLLRQMKKGNLNLHHLMNAAYPKRDTRLLIFVDRFEELFFYEENQIGFYNTCLFVSMLLNSCRPYCLPDGQYSNGIYVIAAINSAFLGFIDRLQGMSDIVNSGGISFLPRLDEGQMSEAIEGPLRLLRIDVDPNLTKRIIAFVDRLPQPLLYLQTFLQALWIYIKKEGRPPRTILASDAVPIETYWRLLSKTDLREVDLILPCTCGGQGLFGLVAPSTCAVRCENCGRQGAVSRLSEQLHLDEKAALMRARQEAITHWNTYSSF